MPTTSTIYVSFDPMRICDTCGDFQRKSKMWRTPGGLYACPNDTGERSALQLDRANARQRPFRILPVKDAKPETWNLPDSYESDEGEILNFIGRAVSNGCRYESVVGGEPAPIAGQKLPTLAWSARYLYGLIVENKRPTKWILEAKALLTTIADTLRTRQVGVSVSATTQAAFGAFLEPGTTVYVTNDTAACGLAMLYAYRILGTASYLTSARMTASYLRNVQAIGRYGSNYTSSNAAGTARFYTGAVCSEVSSVGGVDPGEHFYSNHLFYLKDLLALQFWSEFLATDGDQLVGATTAVDGFIQAPAQLLSLSISDMRACWADGIRDASNNTITGFSADTPREYFNAYPATKPQFSTVTGTGMWEFVDGNASVGTAISSQNIAVAVSSMYAYEGASVSVASISDWLRGFTGNVEFEASGTESLSYMARSVLGNYDPTLTLPTLLTVRNEDSYYSAAAVNGTGLYDWGALGLLSPLWGTRNATSFVQARLNPLGRNQRFYDGQRSDGDNFDWITNRGRSGLSLQTAFGENVTPGAADISFDLARNSRGSDLEFDEGNIVVPAGELARCNYWRFTTVDDNNGTLFPFSDASYTVPFNSAIVLYNGTGTALNFIHLDSAGDETSLPFFLSAETTLSLPNGHLIVFVRSDTFGAWKQVGPVRPTIFSNGLQSPVFVANDSVAAAQFAMAFRVNPNFPMQE